MATLSYQNDVYTYALANGDILEGPLVHDGHVSGFLRANQAVKLQLFCIVPGSDPVEKVVIEHSDNDNPNQAVTANEAHTFLWAVAVPDTFVRIENNSGSAASVTLKITTRDVV